jgi:tRNA dihydrouridine synthase A
MRRHPPHHLSPARANHPAGQDPEAGSAAPSHHSNAPIKPESQSILSQIIAHLSVAKQQEQWILLSTAARIGEDFGYDEINLNVGCPSDRVQGGRFGACLMAEPALVAEGVAAMKRAVKIPVTVKCRIGIDDQDSEVALDVLARGVIAAGADALIVHARKAWLNGLSPKENCRRSPSPPQRPEAARQRRT